MANSASHASLPYPVKNARYSIPVPYLDADGDPTDPTTPDTEVSKDAGAFADCAEEVTTISGSNGCGYITLSGAETNCSLLLVVAKVASGPKATILFDKPRVLPILLTGTASAGGATSITLAAGAYDLTGCIVRTTGGTGGGGTGGANNQARIITAYNTSTFVATVEPAWETNPSSDTTYDILLTELACNTPVTRGLRPTTDGRTLDVATTGEAGLDLDNTAGALGTSQFDAGFLTAALVATGAIDADALAADAAAEIADAVWDEDATAHQTGGTFGQAIGDPGADTNTIFAATVTNATGNTVGDDTATLLSRLGTPSNLGGGATVAANLSDIEGQTDDIGAAGAGLTAIPWNAAWDAEVQSEVQDAIEVNHLDHFIAVADPGGVVANSSFLAKIVSKSATPAFSSYDNTTDSLEANRDNIGTAGAGLTAADDAVITAIAALNNVTAAAVATAVWQDTTAGDFTVASSIGKSLYTSGVVPGGSGGISIVGSAMTLTSAYDFAKGTVAVTESYNTDGAAPTPVQALMGIMQILMELSFSGTTGTVKKLDGSTTAFTLTINSATTPTSITRAT